MSDAKTDGVYRWGKDGCALDRWLNGTVPYGMLENACASLSKWSVL